MSKITNKIFWPKAYSNKAIFASISVIFLLNVVFIKYFTPLPLLLLILLTIIFFFSLLNSYTVKWQFLHEKVLYRKLFWHSVFYRLIFLGVMYLLTWIYDPESLPLEMFANDAWYYLESGTQLSGNIFNGDFIQILSQFWRSETDWGFPFYLGLVNSLFFNSVVLTKLFNIIWGSLTVVYLAKTARLLYTPKHGLITGIIAMLLPSFAWFSALYLKETLMIFIIVLIFFSTVKMVKKGKFSLLSSLIIIMGIFSLFYFRTVLAVVVALSLLIYFISNISFAKQSRVIILFLALIFIGGLYSASTQLDNLEEVRAQYLVLEGGDANRILYKMQLAGNLDVKSSLSIPLVLLNAFISPYPSFLDIDERQIGVISHSQNEITRILMYYFALIGLFILIRKNFKNSSLIISFTVGYILILAITGASYFDRFQLPAVPFMVIMMSVGIIDSPRKWVNNWNKYIVLILAATVLWHLFKFYIRS